MVESVARALLAMQRQSWEQGVTMQAFLERGDDAVVFALAKEAAYRAAPDGRPALIGATDGCTDPCSTGEAMIYAYAKTKDPQLGEACARLEEWALRKAPRNSGGIIYHLTNQRQFWVDSCYMLPPYLLAAGHKQEALRQLEGYWNALYNPNAGLMSHMWDDAEGRFTRKAFWGVGNGWAAAALARMIDMLPVGRDRERLIQKAKPLVEALLSHMLPEGTFHDVLGDPESFTEVNLSQMLAYTIFRATRSGWGQEEWRKPALIMREAARKRVDAFGLVQGVCGAPTFDRPGVAPEGQAFHLLMEAAFARLSA